MGNVGSAALTRPWVQMPAVWGLASATAVLMIAPVWRATLRIGTDYNEGWNAVLTARLMSGEPLYPAFDALSANNYPPLSFYAAGWLGHWVGDYLIAGRLLAFLGFFISAVAVAAIVKRITSHTPAALLSGLLLLGYNAAVNPQYIGFDDPQWLGHGIMLLGLLAFLASEQRGWLFLLAAGLMLAAGFVKHLLLPIPLAASLWLVLYRRQMLALWLATCAVLLVSALLLCFAAYGSDFFEGVFRDARGWRLDRAAAGSGWLGRALPLLLLATLALPSAWQRAEGRLVVYYAAISAVQAVFVLGGAGVGINAVFDLEIALCLIVGLGVQQFDENDRSAAVEVGSGIVRSSDAVPWGLLLVLVGLYLPSRLSEVRQLWWESERREAEATEVIDLLTKQRGPVACEDLNFCYWAGKGFEIDFFLLGQKLEQGFINPRVVTELLRNHYYAAIQTMAIDGSSSRLPSGINREIAANYELVRTGTEGAVLLPRRP
jgi:hypothetical protein